MERFTFSWSCSWGTVCWHMLSYAAMFRHVELCSVIYFRSCHWCVDAIEKDRKNTWNLLGWRWNFFNQKTQQICHCRISNVHVVSRHPNIRQLLIPNPRARSSDPRSSKKKTPGCWHVDSVDRVFWCFLGLVSFPKVCKKPPSYNNFQRKTTHQTTELSNALELRLLRKGVLLETRGSFPHNTSVALGCTGGTTPNDVSVACETGNGSNVLPVSFWNRQKVMTMFGCHCLQHLDLLCTFFYHGNRVTLPRPRFLQGNRRKWQNLWGVVLGSISWGEVAPSCHSPPHHPPSCPLQRDGRWDSDPSSRYPLPKVSCDLTFWETQWKQATQPQIHQAPHTKNGRMFMNHHWFRKLLHENQMKSEIPSVVAGADI